MTSIREKISGGVVFVVVTDETQMRVQKILEFLDAKDPYTRRHSEQVGRYAVDFAGFAGFCVDLDVLHTASLLHDVGKLFVPLEIIRKTSQLTADEFTQMQGHSAGGWEMLRANKNFTVEAEIVRYHHERWDGGGYPGRLAEENIPLASRIIHIIDAVDVMLTPRTYKQPYHIERVISELRRCSGTQFDPNLAQLAVDWARVSRIHLPYERKAA